MSHSLQRHLRRPLRSLAIRILGIFSALCVFGLPARATWSIVIVDRATGEICVATATCLGNFDLQRWVPVIVVGEGGAAAQSTLDQLAVQRRRIRDAMRRGFSPQFIIDYLAVTHSSHQTRQYGIVNFDDAPITHTGTLAGGWAGGLTGEVDTLAYAIQGNVLTGSAVIEAAERALLQSEGDLSQRVMSVMEAARLMGGDGRCSCSQAAPESCGAPPANFNKSSHVACIVLARPGDSDGVCSGSMGCVSGSYYLKLQFSGLVNDPDPVIALQGLYDGWRQGLAGRPDHLRSVKTAAATRLPADGVTSTRVDVQLFDLEGIPITVGGAALTVSIADGSGAHASVGAIQDHGNGAYSFDLTAGTTTGVDEWSIVVDDGNGPVTLYPWLKVAVDPLAPLHAGFRQVHAESSPEVPFVLNAPASAGDAYVLLGSSNGTSPGQSLGGTHLPLNGGVFHQLTRTQAGSALFPNTIGTLDANGRAQCAFAPTPGLLGPLVGRRLDWAAMVFDSGGNSVLGPVGFDVRP